MRHVDSLSAVAAERLRALPDVESEPYGWAEFKRRASRAARVDARYGTAAALTTKAAAAMLLVAGATALTAWMWGESARPAHLSSEIAPVSTNVEPRDKRDGRSDSEDSRERAMELWLAHQPAEPAMVRVGAYAAVAGLEDRIAQLDDLLTTARVEGVEAARLSPLEEQRTRLVSSLAQVRYAETLVSGAPP